LDKSKVDEKALNKYENLCSKYDTRSPVELATRMASYYFQKDQEAKIGGGFPAPYDATVRPFPELAKVINTELDRLFENIDQDVRDALAYYF